MIMDGVPLMVVARNLGHADTRMVEKDYGHLATSYMREAIRAAKPLGIGNAAKVIPMAGSR
jgi:integrase